MSDTSRLLPFPFVYSEVHHESDVNKQFENDVPVELDSDAFHTFTTISPQFRDDTYMDQTDLPYFSAIRSTSDKKNECQHNLLPTSSHSSTEEIYRFPTIDDLECSENDEEAILYLPQHYEDDRRDWLTQVLPDEVLHRVYYNLDASAIVQTSRVCRRMKMLASQKSLWLPAVETWNHSTQIRFENATCYQEYAHCYREEVALVEWQRIEGEKVQRQLYERQRWRIVSRLLNLFFFNLSIDFLTVFSFILGTIYAALRCQEIILWSWSLVLSPFYIVLLQLFVIPPVYYTCVSFFESPPFLTWPGRNLWCRFFRSRFSYRRVYYAFLLSLAIFLVLLMVKLNLLQGSIPAWTLAIPCNILSIAIITDQLLGWSGRMLGTIRNRVFVCVAGFLLACSSITITLKIDGILPWSWIATMSPLLTLLPVLVLFPLFFYIGFGVAFFDCRSSHSAFSVVYVLFYLTGLVVPIYTWLILIARNLDGGHMAWPIVFIPIFIVDANMLTICIINAIKAS